MEGGCSQPDDLWAVFEDREVQRRNVYGDRHLPQLTRQSTMWISELEVPSRTDYGGFTDILKHSRISISTQPTTPKNISTPHLPLSPHSTLIARTALYRPQTDSKEA